MQRLVAAVLICCLLGLLHTARSDSAASCQGQTNCSSCLAAHPGCAWCQTEGFAYDHCDRYLVMIRLCPSEDIVFPARQVTVVKNTSLSDQTGSSQPVQVAPQHISLKLRPHEPYEFEIQYRQAADYPLDLYYVMDLTWSMRDDKEKLEALGEEMATILQGLTKNFRVGFGSFVDKPVMPYVSQVPENKENPCALYGGRECVPTYGFRNHLNLTRDAYQFTKEVRAAQVSANNDDLEGGLDALVQVVSCAEKIGWTKTSRKLIIYTSGGQFHLAGEGLLGGAVKRNDLLCHLDDKGLYTLSTQQDYPSVEELDLLLRKEGMSVVFAVTDQYQAAYRELTKVMRANVQVESLLDDSANILAVIKRQYENITSRIELTDDAGAGISVSYRSRCLDGEMRERSRCTGIKTGDQVSLLVTVESHGCPAEKKQTIRIRDALTSETVLVDLEVLCSCDCERPGQTEENSDKCSGVGRLQCGVCSCPDNRAGWQCECSSEGLGGHSCRPGNSTQGPECSGRGDCVCGKCECRTSSDPNHVVSGQYCQCDNFLCDRAPDGSICGGETRGVCECGECMCRPGWTGDDCACNNDTRNCAPADSRTGQVCSGKGDCVCGRCRCYNTEQGRYAGLFCEVCPTCGGLCRLYQPCVQCLLRSGGDAGHDCTDCSNNYVLALKNQLGSEEDRTICRFEDDLDGCIYRFQYYTDADGQAIVNVLKHKECREVNTLAIVLGTVGSVLAVGLLTLLLWRAYTYVADRREYAQFERDLLQMQANHTNDLYQSPITSYRVPDAVMATFRGDDD